MPPARLGPRGERAGRCGAGATHGVGGRAEEGVELEGAVAGRLLACNALQRAATRTRKVRGTCPHSD